jgi:hypothetical protein
MKAIISEIDNHTNHDSKDKILNHPPNTHQQPNNFSQLASSQLFDNFGKSETFVVENKAHVQPPVERAVGKVDERI